MARKTTRFTGEGTLVRTVRFGDIPAFGTHLRCIAWVYKDDRYARKLGFILNLRPKVVKCPRMLLPALTFPNPYPVAYAGQIFECDTASGALSLINNSLGDYVVDVSGKALFFALAVFEKALSRLSAFGLKLRAKLGMAFTKAVDMVSGKGFAGGINSDILNAEVNADPVVRFVLRRFGHFDTDVEIENTVLIHKVGLTPDTSGIKLPVIAEGKGNINPLVKSLEIDDIGKLEFPDAVVIDDSTMRLEAAMLLFIPLVRFGGLAYSAYCHLRRQAKLLSDVVIAEMVQFYLSARLMLKGNIGDMVTGSVKGFHRLEKLLFLLIRGM